MFEQITQSQIFALISIPFISGFVGWFTNWLALKMTFYPIEYKGIRPFGWQGIIPSKAKKMAEKSVDLLTAKLLKIEEQFDQIDPNRMAEEMTPSLGHISRQIIDEVMDAQLPKIWSKTPQAVKDNIYQRAQKGLPNVVAEMMQDIRDNLEDVLDLKRMTVTLLMKDKALVNQIFQRCGKDEFVFIERSGFYFGFLFGIPQMVSFYFYNPWWMLPLFGLLVGYATNWLALKLIFEPMHPQKIGPVVWQGLFLKRQKEVAIEYSSIISARIVNSETLFGYMMRGPGSNKLAVLIRQHVEQIIDSIAGSSQYILEWIVGNQRMEIIKNIAFYRLQQELPIAIRKGFPYAEEALDIQNMLREKMTALSPEEFEGFLRPAFQEDETTLILVGALLGMIAGFIQYWAFFM